MAILKELEKTKKSCETCEKCKLCKTRNNVVFSDGAPNHKLMLIGEAPGFYEDQKGIRPVIKKWDSAI